MSPKLKDSNGRKAPEFRRRLHVVWNIDTRTVEKAISVTLRVKQFRLTVHRGMSSNSAVRDLK